MKFKKLDNDTYQMMSISGPTHNLLRLVAVNKETNSDPEVRDMKNNQVNPKLDGTLVKQQVLAGVREANLRNRTNFAVTKIEYVSDDSPPVERYREFALAILDRVHHQPNDFDSSQT